MSSIKWKWNRLVARMARDRASPEFAARGWAIGMFYGCVIPFGFQLMLSIPTAMLLKGSKVGATLGTLITNHFTIFVIYPVQCWAGNLVLKACGAQVTPVGELVKRLNAAGERSMLSADFWHGLATLGGDVLAAFFIGGFLLAAVCVPPTYFGVLNFMRGRRARRRKDGNVR